jgi:hypothetical protein
MLSLPSNWVNNIFKGYDATLEVISLITTGWHKKNERILNDLDVYSRLLEVYNKKLQEKLAENHKTRIKTYRQSLSQYLIESNHNLPGQKLELDEWKNIFDSFAFLTDLSLNDECYYLFIKNEIRRVNKEINKIHKKILRYQSLIRRINNLRFLFKRNLREAIRKLQYFFFKNLDDAHAF